MQTALWLGSGRDDDEADSARPPWADDLNPAELEELPYHVEVWDETASVPEILVAVAMTPALAYAAYYAAAREFAGRDVTLKHKGMTLSHWRTRSS